MKKNILIVLLLLIIGCMGVELYNTKMQDDINKSSKKASINANVVETQTIDEIASNTEKSMENIVQKENDSYNNMVSESKTTSKDKENVEDLIIGDWMVSDIKTEDGKEIGLNEVFGTGIHSSNVMTFKQDGKFSYAISITAGNGGETYTVNENVVKYSVATDMKDVFTWHTAKYNAKNDTLEEEVEDLVNGKYIITYKRAK